MLALKVSPLVLVPLFLMWPGLVAAQVVIDTDYGFDEWISPGPDDTVYDASTARWDFRNTDEDEPVKATEGCNGNMINRYPVTLQRFDNLTLERPLIEGHVSLTAVWGHIYDGGECNSSAIVMQIRNGVSEQNHVIDGARLDRVWDGIRPGSREDEFYTIRNTWITDARDDCIEADGSPPGLIEDSLFDGCFQGISMRAGANNNSENNDKTLTIDRLLMKINAHNHSEASGADPRFASGGIFKHKGRSAQVIVNNSVFAFDSPDVEGATMTIMIGDETFGGRHGEDLISCENNEILWLNDVHGTPLPQDFNELDPCFTIFTGVEARERWDAARCKWINDHPPSVTRRLASDPVTCGDVVTEDMGMSDDMGVGADVGMVQDTGQSDLGNRQDVSSDVEATEDLRSEDQGSESPTDANETGGCCSSVAAKSPMQVVLLLGFVFGIRRWRTQVRRGRD